LTSWAQSWPGRCAGDPFLYLTTTGRRTGHPHRIEIWFAVQDGKLYLMAGGRDRADWVRNLRTNARVTVELGGETHQGVARVLAPETAEDQLCRQLLVSKYGDEEDLDAWGRTALPIVIEF
jgi:deazaflavin-dependent oxidoreductase (nitroreductase family)